MTNDELEAVRARASAFRLGDDDAEFQRDMDRMRRFRPAEAKQVGRLIEDMRVVVRTDIPALLDEVKRLTEQCRALGENCFRHAGEIHRLELRATRAEAHAERLAGALEMTRRTEGLCFEFKSGRVHAVRQNDITKDLRKIDAAREDALSAYRSAKDEACSRPSDALDAPVQPTSSSPAQATGHASDCALHNAPALPVGPCDCGAGGVKL